MWGDMEKTEKFSCDIWITILDELSQGKAGQTLFNISALMFDTLNIRGRSRNWGEGENFWKK